MFLFTSVRVSQLESGLTELIFNTVSTVSLGRAKDIFITPGKSQPDNFDHSAYDHFRTGLSVPVLEKLVSDNGMTFFDEPGEIMSDKSYKVSRVVSDGAALARGKGEYGSSYYGLEVLLWDENANYYDDQIVKAPNGKCFRQIGIYKNGFSTYPIVTLTNSVSGQKSETKKTTQKIEKPKIIDVDRNRIIEPTISTESSKTETSNPKLDKNKAYRLVRD